MNNLNSIIIEGNVVRKPELVEPVKDFKVCRFQVAVDRWYKKSNGDGATEVSYFDVETYNKMAEFCAEQCFKGRGVRVVGRLKQDRWKDSNDKTASRVYVIAEHIEYKPKPADKNSNTTEKVEITADANDKAPEEQETTVLETEEAAVF